MSFKRASTREQITQYLLERILDGTYKPGERLIELNIANELNTSQAPVREALRYLEAMRMVVTEPYKGTRVREITDRELEESSQVRAALEELGAELAAPNLKGNVARITDESKQFMKAARQKDVQKYSQHDIEFHRLIMEASGNQLLLSIWESVVLESRFRRTLNRIGEDQLVEFGEAHLPVIDALNEGDGKKAASILKNLICKFHFLKRAN
ncbi:MAG TPA: GntR family transcriptional regulator [Candidatus Melainabacteria bacterium]|jgi:DNA-binding GntR family transcriptional regulator|nr:GntR family transcriptional regulator [Candidatus Melainabacteria bacterium]HIN66684.1 GntR family transcriptional regulator [Candidatus Obscuribacterales bacterium]